MNYENEKNEVLNLSNQGYSSRKIAEKLGISKSKANNIVRENNLLMSKSSLEDVSTMSKVSTILQDEVSKMSTTSNLSQQNMSIMSKITQDNMSKVSTIEQNTASILSKLPENVRILVENLVSPADVELSAQERQEEIKFCVGVSTRHLKAKTTYKLFIDTMTELAYADLVLLDEIDRHILNLKSIIQDTDYLYNASTANAKQSKENEIFYLPSVYARSILKYFYSMKMHLRMNGEEYGEISNQNKSRIDKWLSMDIQSLFPFIYDSDCANIELGLGI